MPSLPNSSLKANKKRYCSKWNPPNSALASVINRRSRASHSGLTSRASGTSAAISTNTGGVELNSNVLKYFPESRGESTKVVSETCGNSAKPFSVLTGDIEQANFHSTGSRIWTRARAFVSCRNLGIKHHLVPLKDEEARG